MDHGVVDGGGFGPGDGDPSGECATEVLVVGTDRAGILRAMNRAVARLGRVTWSGTEHDSDEAAEAAGMAMDGSCWVSPAAARAGGTHVWVDNEGNLLPAEMGATYRRIVREELAAADVQEATLSLPGDDEPDPWEASVLRWQSAPVFGLGIMRCPVAALRAMSRHLPAGTVLAINHPIDPVKRPNAIGAYLERVALPRETGGLGDVLPEAVRIPLDVATIDGLWAAGDQSEWTWGPGDLIRFFAFWEGHVLVDYADGPSHRPWYARADTPGAVLQALTVPEHAIFAWDGATARAVPHDGRPEALAAALARALPRDGTLLLDIPAARFFNPNLPVGATWTPRSLHPVCELLAQLHQPLPERYQHLRLRRGSGYKCFNVPVAALPEIRHAGAQAHLDSNGHLFGPRVLAFTHGELVAYCAEAVDGPLLVRSDVSLAR